MLLQMGQHRAIQRLFKGDPGIAVFDPDQFARLCREARQGCQHAFPDARRSATIDNHAAAFRQIEHFKPGTVSGFCATLYCVAGALGRFVGVHAIASPNTSRATCDSAAGFTPLSL